MSSFASDQSLYSESEEEEARAKFIREGDGNDSDFTESFPGIQGDGESTSYTNLWPQSFRQSIDIYSTVQSPTIGFLGASSLSRLGGSFFASSSPNITHPADRPDTLQGLGKPLLCGILDEKTLKEQQNHSHALLTGVRLRKHSEKDARLSKVSHELPIPGHCSFGQAVLNCMNVLCGVGILSTPYAVKEGGWIGLAILLLFASLSYYTGILLRRCLDSEPGLHTYPDIGQAAFGIMGRIIISIILYVDLYACCVEYIILESDNISSLFPNANLYFGGFHLNSRHIFAVLSAITVLPTVWLRDYSIMSYLSAGGVVATTLVVLCLLWTGVADDQIGFHNRGRIVNPPNLSVALGVFGFCYSGHAVIPNIYLSLEKPNQFPRILLVSFLACSVMYVGAAVMGFMMFGESTQSQFTLNMPQSLISSRIAVWTTVVNPLTKYPCFCLICGIVLGLGSGLGFCLVWSSPGLGSPVWLQLSFLNMYGNHICPFHESSGSKHRGVDAARHVICLLCSHQNCSCGIHLNPGTDCPIFWAGDGTDWFFFLHACDIDISFCLLPEDIERESETIGGMFVLVYYRSRSGVFSIWDLFYSVEDF